MARDLPRGIVFADAGYGNDSGFRQGITALELPYCVGILSSTTVWASGTGPLAPKPRSGRGRPPTNLRRGEDHQPVSVKTLAFDLSENAWEDVTWREGSDAPLRLRFARVRVRPAHRDEKRAEPWPGEWLLVEWPDGEEEPSRYWPSMLPEDTPLKEMVRITKLRWHIERDYRELKQEVGLGHFEGRGWRGFHHHATLCIAAYGFLVRERLLFPPPDQLPNRGSRNLPFPTVADPGAPPIRTLRHVPHSIPTLRILIAVALARKMPRCPCCLQTMSDQHQETGCL